MESRSITPLAVTASSGIPEAAQATEENGQRQARGLGLDIHRVLAGQAFVGLAHVARQWREESDPEFRQTKRAVQQVIDLIQEDDACLVGLACCGAGGDTDAAHAARVAVLSLAIAQQTISARADLQALALAALWYDGSPAQARTDGIPDNELVSKNRALGVVHRAMATLPLEDAMAVAVVALAAQEGSRESPGSNAAIAHATPNARLIRAIAAFDDLCWHQLDDGTRLRSDRAIRHLLEPGACVADLEAVRRLVRTVGLYPPGSLVRLDDGTRAVVVRAHRSPAGVRRPQVMTLGQSGSVGTCIDLRWKDTQGRYERSVRQVMDPETSLRGNGGDRKSVVALDIFAGP